MRLRHLDPRTWTSDDRNGTGARGDRTERDGDGPTGDGRDGPAAGRSAGDDGGSSTGPPLPTDSASDSPRTDAGDRSTADVAADDLLELLSNRRRRYLWRALRREPKAEVELSDASRLIAAWENDVAVGEVEYDQRKSVYNSLHQFHCPKMADAGLVEFDKRSSTVRLAAELPAQLTVTVEPDTEDVRNTAFGALALAAGVVLGAWALDLPVFGTLSLGAVGLSLGIGASAALLVYTLFLRTEFGLSLADALSRVDG
ncbi:hypothetical protein [Halorubrum sp. 2020YC2]|uniref:DUF7344 domain-containing protein n=1 Tax=Halorubrum sp. 2020YC2 TaxID=2836432 RepID=UPI001BEC87E7|nr:hypothetical protein [Halorubrum sp. 2020YC2]QWC19688.1 hypothetical protein KI388_01550 [Halorubrum sp. 2020YC2]